MPSLDHLWARHPETERESSPGQLVECDGGHRRHRGGTGGDLEDARSDFDCGRLGRHPGQHGDRVGAPRLRSPYDVVSELLGEEHRLDVEVASGAHIAEIEAESHAHPGWTALTLPSRHDRRPKLVTPPAYRCWR